MLFVWILDHFLGWQSKASGWDLGTVEKKAIEMIHQVCQCFARSIKTTIQMHGLFS